MKFKIALLFYTNIFLLIECYSQDKIIFTSGKERKCIVLSEDSATVSVILRSNGKDFNTVLDRKNIQSIVYESTLRQKDKITFLDGNTIECRILRVCNDSVSILKSENGQSIPIYINRNNIKFIERQNDSITISEMRLRNGNSVISIYSGMNVPLSDYSSTASLGADLSIQLSIGLSQNFGLIIKGYGLINEPEVNKNNTNWKSGGLLGGIELTIPNIPFDIQFRALGGQMVLISPESNYKSESIEFKEVTTNTFGYNIGLGLKFRSPTDINFLLKIDYLHGNFRFNEPISTSTYKMPPAYDPYGQFSVPGENIINESYKQIMSTLSISIGIAFKL